MMVKNMVEIIQRSFKDMAGTECRKRISLAQREFVGESMCLIADVDLTLSTTFPPIYYVDEMLVGGGGRLETVHKVMFIDVNGLELDIEEQDLGFAMSDRTLTITDYDGDDLTAWPSSVDHIRVRGVWLPQEDSSETFELTVEERFHRGVLSRVLQDIHAERGNVPMAQYYYNICREAIREAKKYALTDGTRLTTESVNNTL